MTTNPTHLSDGIESYKRTGTFTEVSVPAGLLRDHSTKDGVWGVIHVELGQLRYRITDPRRAGAEMLLTPDDPGLVEPTILHHVEPIGPVRFHVEFFRPAAGSIPPCRGVAEGKNQLRAEEAAAAAPGDPQSDTDGL